MAEDLKICRNCGAPLSENQLMCPACGTRWGTDALDAEPTQLAGHAKIQGESLDDAETILKEQGIGPGLDSTVTSESATRSRYRILDTLGEGGMGVVYKAEDTKLRRTVAIKRLLPKAEAQQKGLDRFLREAHVVAGLNHINIVNVFDIERDAKGPFIVMEYVEGKSLERVIEEEGKIEESRAIELFKQVCQAIGYAHRVDIIHRDIKPANIIITSDGVPKVLDFGLAQMATESDLSKTGYGMGTMYYMPPEQTRDAKNVDHRADIYALGATLYHMLTGERPKLIKADKLSAGLKALVFKCMEENPRDRYFSISEILVDVESSVSAKDSKPPRLESEDACHNCGYVNPESARFCKACGTGLFEKCPKCEGENRVGSKYCMSCGLNIPDFKKSQEHLQRAQEYLKEYKYSRAIKELKAALELEVEKAELQSLLSEAQEKLSRLNEHREKAEVQKQDGSYEEAEQAVLAAIDLDPHDETLHLLKGDIQNLIQEMHLREARAKAEQEDYEGALCGCDKVFKYNPNNREASELRDEVLANTKRKVEFICAKIKESRARINIEVAEGLRHSRYMQGEKECRLAEEALNCGEIGKALRYYNQSLEQYSAAARELAIYDALPLKFENSVGMEFVLIPAGEFMMGSPEGEGDYDERPQHKVIITRPFYMQTTPVTQAQWKKVIGRKFLRRTKNPSYFKGDDLPVERVSWKDAQRFLEKLNQKEQKGRYRLPTEAEWEYACRAGSATKYSFGNDEGRLGEYAWYDKNSGGKTHPVGQKKPNAWGLYDMHGNVWEWCSDWYDKDYYRNSPSRNPKGPTNGRYRVLRGGSWS